MRTSMAMAGLQSGGEGKAGARAAGAGGAWWGRARAWSRGSDGSAARTDRAGQSAQVDVEARDKKGARRLRFAHVVENHAVIVSIPGPGFGVSSCWVGWNRPATGRS
ncbi:hypothetical protein GCM10009612_19830 [Streptomyces beijiangensis]